jgi:hypothetical protein
MVPHQKGLKNVIIKVEFLVMAIIIGYKAQSTPFPWGIELNT